ncbi:exocyst complex subunit Sec3 [Schizosaccharomyces osmophilus]|uniref:Exocyst complex subunit Sec3 n=1 Tax=Schizosaccharomyces osmophilus TaxID=2545709 RepID=A0AAE9WF14_9SCHI|nr:exocyst complex subunit Sec3 [Schizosaccharomyces osmophilus]WBW73568.1 exocyst complex subunit Sec3 [Schizosaccharomyces osmophilus]
MEDLSGDAIAAEIIQAVNLSKSVDKQTGNEKAISYLGVEEERGVTVVGSKMKPRYIVLSYDENTHVFNIHRLKASDKGGMQVVRSWPLFELQGITVIDDRDVTFTINKPHLLRSNDTVARNKFIFSLAKQYMYYMGRPLSVLTTDGRKVDWAYRNSFVEDTAKPLSIPKARNSLPESTVAAPSPSSSSRNGHLRNFSDGPIVTNLETDFPSNENEELSSSLPTNTKSIKDDQTSDRKPMSHSKLKHQARTLSSSISGKSASSVPDSSFPQKDEPISEKNSLKKPSYKDNFIQEQAQLFPPKSPLRKGGRRDTNFTSDPKKDAFQSKRRTTPSSSSKDLLSQDPMSLMDEKSYVSRSKEHNVLLSDEPNLILSDSSGFNENPFQSSLDSAYSQQLPSKEGSSPIRAPSISTKSSLRNTPVSIPKKKNHSPSSGLQIPAKHPSRQGLPLSTANTSDINLSSLSFQSLESQEFAASTRPKMSTMSNNQVSSDTSPALNVLTPTLRGSIIEEAYNVHSKISINSLPKNVTQEMSQLNWSNKATYKDYYDSMESQFNTSMKKSVQNLVEEDGKMEKIRKNIDNCVAGCDSLSSTINLFSLELSEALNDIMNNNQQIKHK